MPPRAKRKAKADESDEEPEVTQPTKPNKRAKASKGKEEEEEGTGASKVKGEWKDFAGVLTFTPENPKGCAKILGFDIDDTIITTKSGKTFATGPSDWQFWDPCVPEKLKEQHQAGFKIVFFSNQAGISSGKTPAKDFKKKLDNVMSQIPCPVQIYAATEGGKYRKPATGMWGMFANGGNQGVKPDVKQSTYVGDAAGRAANWAPGKKKDFSDSDRKFALNLELGFQTPEEFFKGEKAVPFTLGGVDPKKAFPAGPLFEPQTASLISKKQEMVVMIGYPASGKSYFSTKELEEKGHYVRVNRDTLKTKEKCWKAAEEALAAGKSVVIDNTNPDLAAREPYIEIARKHKVPVRAFWMQTGYDEALHNNFFREVITNNESPHVPTLVYNKFRKDFKEPSTKEGFSEVIKTYFRPRFDDAFNEKIFFMYQPVSR